MTVTEAKPGSVVRCNLIKQTRILFLVQSDGTLHRDVPVVIVSLSCCNTLCVGSMDLGVIITLL